MALVCFFFHQYKGILNLKMNDVYVVNHVNWEMDLQQSLCHTQCRWLLADAMLINNGFVWCVLLRGVANSQ